MFDSCKHTTRYILFAYRTAYLDEKIHAGPALKCILNNFDCIWEDLQEYADSAPADSAAKAQGFANVIGHGNFLLSLKYAAAVLELLENLNCAVQSSGKSAASMISAMKMTVGALNDLRCEDKYQAIFEETVQLCRETVVPLPALRHCHVRDARPDDSVDQRQHRLGRLLVSAVSSFRLWTRQSTS